MYPTSEAPKAWVRLDGNVEASIVGDRWGRHFRLMKFDGEGELKSHIVIELNDYSVKAIAEMLLNSIKENGDDYHVRRLNPQIV